MAEAALTLYDIESDLVEVAEAALSGDPEIERQAFDRLNEALARSVEKRDRVGQFIRHLAAQECFAAQEIKRNQERKARMEFVRQRVEAEVLYAMGRLGYGHLEGRTVTLKSVKNPDSVAILDAAAVPAEFKDVKTEVVILKNNVKAALKAGREVPGAELRGSVRLDVR